VDRALQELQLLGLLTVQHITYGDKIRWPYSLAPGIDRDDLSRLTQKCQYPPEE
jgi:hypothetical protein